MSDTPLVSTIITTYKRPPEIVERALKSIISQTYENIEIIIVDDSPVSYEHRDEVKQMIEKYDGVNYIQHETNQGACVARNTGLANANGEYVAYLDDDDEWLPEKIEKQIAVFDNSSADTALVYCSQLVQNDSNGTQTVGQGDFRTGEINDIHLQLVERNFIGSTSFPLLRTEELKRISGFDPFIKSAQDLDVWIRISEHHRINFVPEPLVIYHWHDGEQITKNPKNKIQGLERINEKNKDVLDRNKNIFYTRTIALPQYYSMDGQIKKAITTWLKCVKIKPFNIKKNLECLYHIVKLRKK